MLAAAPVVTAGFAALAAAGASSAATTAINMAPRNMNPPVDEFAPHHDPTTRQQRATARHHGRGFPPPAPEPCAQPVGCRADGEPDAMPRHRPRPSRRSRGSLPVYRGPFRRAQAERLLWRAGFGPRRGQAERFAELGLEGAVHALTHPRSRRARGSRAEDRRPRARAARRLGPRRPVVARPDGPHRGAAGRADGARLARLVRDQQGDGRRALDAAAERAAAPARARATSARSCARSPGPGDADVARRHRQQPLGAERELRARAAGAVHARRRPRLRRARRARDGARAHRLARRLARRRRDDELPLRPRIPRPRAHAHPRAPRPPRLARRGRPRGRPPRCTPASS